MEPAELLFITVAPERDTTELLCEYTAAFDPRILGLTGSAVRLGRPWIVLGSLSVLAVFFEALDDSAFLA